METNNKEPNAGENCSLDTASSPSAAFAILVAAAISIYAATSAKPHLDILPPPAGTEANDLILLLPKEGVVLPIEWHDLGAKMVSVGVIDAEKFESLYVNRGGLTEEQKQLLYGGSNGSLKITHENSGFILHLLWAFGLGNKNSILEDGPMKKYGDASRLASTGGWTIAKGDTMEHYSRHPFILLTPEQQELIIRVSKNIYRPCCNNPTYFPDCNHGMAMLALLELMASQGADENEMYRTALKVNSYWFPDTYLTIAEYLKEKRGLTWDEADPKEILGKNYSSFSGYQKILSEVTTPDRNGKGSCGV